MCMFQIIMWIWSINFNTFLVLQDHHVQIGGNETRRQLNLDKQEGLVLALQVPLLVKQPMKASLVLQEIKEVPPQEVVKGNHQGPIANLVKKVGDQLNYQ